MLPKIFLTFHCLNKLFQRSKNFWKFWALSLELQKFFSIIRTIFLTVDQNNFGNKIPKDGSPLEDSLKKQYIKLHNIIHCGQFCTLLLKVCSCFLLHQTAGNVTVSASKTCKPHTVQKSRKDLRQKHGASRFYAMSPGWKVEGFRKYCQGL